MVKLFTSNWPYCPISTMGRGPPITDEERGRMNGLHEAGLGVRKIARRLERSANGVSCTLQAPAAP
ncbi:hypothetical protein L915_03313 [Phytophthora nicotianae]|uniref:Transposase IS30-like HTH domain-containing protein n=1 Tax=Phytophthora nicotianae TaxID=4792 RepID=W2HGF6_PHYNI|nr:hypothetical protein L915_03313 [Phytophthora nicotianae]